MANEKAPTIVIEDDFAEVIKAAEPKPIRYGAYIEALIAKDAARTPEQVEAGLHAVAPMVFPTTEPNSKGEQKDSLVKYKRYFQDSAKFYGKSARELTSFDNGDGTTIVRFYVIDQVKRVRKPKAVPAPTANSDAESADTPEAVAA